jgi:hypothetical protein
MISTRLSSAGSRNHKKTSKDNLMQAGGFDTRLTSFGSTELLGFY